MQIKEMIVEVLTSQGVSGSPGPYIPTFYLLESGLHVCSNEASKVRQHRNLNHLLPLVQLNILCISESLNAAALSSPILPDGT